MDQLSGLFIFFVRELLTRFPHQQLVLFSDREARLVDTNGRLILILQAFGLELAEIDLWISESIRRFSDKGLNFIIFHDDFNAQSLSSVVQWWSYIRKPRRFMVINSLAVGTYRFGWWWCRTYIKLVKRAADEMRADRFRTAALHEIDARLRRDLHSLDSLAHFQEEFITRGYQATVVLSVIMFTLFVLEEWWGGSTYMPTLFAMGANTHGLLEDPWRLFASIFLHSGFLHIFANLYVLAILGSFFNRLLGDAKFIVLFITSGLAGSLASGLLGAGEISVGASGGLWGLFGASAALIVRPSSLLPDLLRDRIKRITFLNLVINLAISFLPMVDIWAHLGGGTGGFVVGLLFVGTKSHSKSRSWVNLAVMSAGLVVASFTIIWSLHSPWTLIERPQLALHRLGASGLSIALPELMAEISSQRSTTITQQQFQFGEVPFTPLAVSVRVRKNSVELNSEERLRTMEQQNSIFDQHQQNWQVISRVQQIIHDNPTRIIVRRLSNGSEYHELLQVRQDYLVGVDLYILPDTPPLFKASVADMMHWIKP